MKILISTCLYNKPLIPTFISICINIYAYFEVFGIFKWLKDMATEAVFQA